MLSAENMNAEFVKEEMMQLTRSMAVIELSLYRPTEPELEMTKKRIFNWCY